MSAHAYAATATSSLSTDSNSNSQSLSTQAMFVLYRYQINDAEGKPISAAGRILQSYVDLLKSNRIVSPLPQGVTIQQIAKAAEGLNAKQQDWRAVLDINEPGSQIPASDLAQILSALPIMPPSSTSSVPPEDEDAQERAEEDAALASINLSKEQMQNQTAGEPLSQAQLDALLS